MMSHMEWKTEGVRGHTNAHMCSQETHKTTEGLRQRTDENKVGLLSLPHD